MSKPRRMRDIQADGARRRRRALYLWQVEGRSLADIGREMGVCRQRVWFLVGQALKRKEKPEK